jgi:prepilin-type N-terminal cleavage/methylation domain-containing protein
MSMRLSSDRSILREAESGFTLIELLAVAVLLSILSAILYGSITAVLSGRELVTAQRQIALSAQQILDQFSKDLVSREAIPLEKEKNGSSQQGSQEPTPQSGFSGFGVRRYFESTNQSKSEQPTDSLRLVTQGVPNAVLSERRNFGVIEVAYRIEELPRNQRGIGTSTRYRLIREETPAAVSDQKTREAQRVSTVMADFVTGFNLRFLLNGKWQDEWTGSTGRAFPEVVELSLTLIDENDTTHLFRTAVAVAKRQAASTTSSSFGQSNEDP